MREIVAGKIEEKKIGILEQCYILWCLYCVSFFCPVIISHKYNREILHFCVLGLLAIAI